MLKFEFLLKCWSINSSPPSAAYMRQWIGAALVQMSIRRQAIISLQNKCRTADIDRQNLGRSGKLSFFIIYKFWQNCASVRQVSDLILKNALSKLMLGYHQWNFSKKSNFLIQ